MKQGSAKEPGFLNKAVIGASVILDTIFFRKCCNCRDEELGTGCES